MSAGDDRQKIWSAILSVGDQLGRIADALNAMRPRGLTARKQPGPMTDQEVEWLRKQAALLTPADRDALEEIFGPLGATRSESDNKP